MQSAGLPVREVGLPHGCACCPSRPCYSPHTSCLGSYQEPLQTRSQHGVSHVFGVCTGRLRSPRLLLGPALGGSAEVLGPTTSSLGSPTSSSPLKMLPPEHPQLFFSSFLLICYYLLVYLLFIFNVYGCSARLYAFAPCSCGVHRGGLRSLRLELQMVVRHHVGAGN